MGQPEGLENVTTCWKLTLFCDHCAVMLSLMYYDKCMQDVFSHVVRAAIARLGFDYRQRPGLFATTSYWICDWFSCGHRGETAGACN